MPWTGRSTPVELAKHRRIATFDGYCGDSGDSAQHAARDFVVEHLRSPHLMRGPHQKYCKLTLLVE